MLLFEGNGTPERCCEWSPRSPLATVIPYPETCALNSSRTEAPRAY